MALQTVVIVGRPNVGKSSIFNWIVGRRIAIVDDMSGVTRDRLGSLAQVGDPNAPRYFELIDTGGIGMVDRDDLSDQVERQIDTALNEADLVLFVVDIHDGRMPLDEEVAQRLRYLHKPVILVINKADDSATDFRGEEFYKLGRGKPVYVSVVHNRNRNGFSRLIEEMLPAGQSEKPADEVMKVAVVGRPNTGKSTFINTLARVERVIVSEIPGTTRDAIDVRFELDGLPFLAIDTAGVRRKAKLRDNLDFYSVHRAERSIRRADVVLLFIDPTLGISRLDKQLADYISRQYKPVVFAVNKWDLLADDASGVPMHKYAALIQHAFRTMPYAPIAFITAKTGKNVKALLNMSQSMFKQAKRRVSTGTLNRVVQNAVEAHPPAMRDNRTPKVYYATQVGTEPPTLVLFVNSPTLFDATYQRYLLNVFREKLPYHDIPIKLYLRARSRSEAPLPAGAEEPDGAAERVAAPPPLGPKPQPQHAQPAAAEAVWAHDQIHVSELDREVNELLNNLED